MLMLALLHGEEVLKERRVLLKYICQAPHQGGCLLLSQREGHVHVESSDRADEEGGDSELHGEFS